MAGILFGGMLQEWLKWNIGWFYFGGSFKREVIITHKIIMPHPLNKQTHVAMDLFFFIQQKAASDGTTFLSALGSLLTEEELWGEHE